MAKGELPKVINLSPLDISTPIEILIAISVGFGIESTCLHHDRQEG